MPKDNQQGPKVDEQTKALDKIKSPPKPKAKEEKAPDVRAQVSELVFNQQLQRLKQVLDLVKGKEDVRNRLNAILDPKNLQTSTKLTAEQVNMVIDAYWFAKEYPELYQPVKDLADEMMLTNLSLGGWGIDKSISLVGAIEQSKLFKDAFGSVDEKKRRFPSFRKGEAKQ